MQHCTKSYNKSGFSCKGTPPLLTSPRKWFSYVDTRQNGLIGQQDMITTISANLRPTSRYQSNFIKIKISAIFKSCNLLSSSKLNIDRFLYFGMHKRLTQLVQEFEKTFRPQRKVVMKVVDNKRSKFVTPRTA